MVFRLKDLEDILLELSMGTRVHFEDNIFFWPRKHRSFPRYIIAELHGRAKRALVGGAP